jgi:quinol monooxygenase YgiN
MFVVIARYTVRDREEETVAALLRTMTTLSLAESGCVEYRVQRAVENSSIFVLYEVYVDDAAYATHVETPHFREFVLEQAVPRLVSREREFFTSLD